MYVCIYSAISTAKCYECSNFRNRKSKPLLPSCHITMATEVSIVIHVIVLFWDFGITQDSIPNPIPVWGVQLINSYELLCCYGYHLKPTIEKIVS